MNKLFDWIIRRLGGHTSEEYNETYDMSREYMIRYDAIKNAHEKTLEWFSVKPILVKGEGRWYNAVASCSLNEHIPVERLKQNLCMKLADKLFEDGLVSFDIEDYFDNEIGMNKKLYRGQIHVLLPEGFGMDKIG